MLRGHFSKSSLKNLAVSNKLPQTNTEQTEKLGHLVLFLHSSVGLDGNLEMTVYKA